MFGWPNFWAPGGKKAARLSGGDSVAQEGIFSGPIPELPLAPEILKQHPLLSLIPPRALGRILSGNPLADYPKGTVVFTEDAPCDAIYVILSGRCESWVRGENGANVLEETFGPGDMLGERALLTDEPHRSTVTVITHSVLLRVPSAEMHALFAADPSIAGRFAQAVTNRFTHKTPGRVRRQREQARSRSATVRRVVSLVPLSPRADSLAVVRKLATALRTLTAQSVLVLHITAQNAPQNAPQNFTGGSSHFLPSLEEWPRRERHLHGEFSFRQSLQENEAGFFELRLSAGTESRNAAFVAALLSHCARHFDFVLIHVGGEIPVPVTIETMIQSDLAYVLLQPSVQNLYDFQLLIRELCDHSRGDCLHVKPILFAEEHEAAADTHAALQRIGHPVHSFARGFPLLSDRNAGDRRFDLHINRLAREIARCRLGIALSSGGAKGLAHIGVIQVLEENGIEVDCIAGSSMGAYVGAMWAHGLDGEMLSRVAHEHEGRWGLLSLVDPVLPPRQGFLKTRRIVHRLRRSIGDAHFSDMIRPLRVVGTHLDTLERIVFSTGDVADTVAASIAIPGVCVPVTIGGETYIDGGIADPLPVDVLEEMGIEKILAVNVIPPPEKLRHWLDLEREQAHHRARSANLGRALLQHINYFAHGNILDTMFQAVNGAQTRVAEFSSQHADVLIRPLACDGVWHDFTKPGKYIALGRQAALEQLDRIKALTHPHEPKPSAPPLAVASDICAA